MSTLEARKPPAPSKPKQTNRYPFLSPRFWHGMRTFHFLALLWRNGFRVRPLRWPMAVIILVCSLFNSVLCRVQQLIYGRRIAKTKIKHPPIFIVGHWRCGTTFLHELLVRDKRFGFPTSYECFVPSHFLVSGWYLPKLTSWLLPKNRPQDNMPAGYDLPQEDEFALLVMGVPTPYQRMAFPRRPTPYMELLDMQNVDPCVLQRFKKGLDWFVRTVTYKQKKRLVLKSPTHTGRVEVLSEMFPGAKFVHIVRDPYEVFPSMRRTWYAMDRSQGFQHPPENLDEMIFECFERMYAGFERQREKIDPNCICDIHYEELIRDPVGVIKTVYEKLDLGDFEAVRDDLQEFVDRRSNYKKNRHEIEPDLKEQIDRRWAGYMAKYGYGSAVA